MTSRKVLSLILLCTFSISCCYWADGASQSPASAPAPSSVDCNNLILSMADCLTFVSNGSTTKPEGNCCSGLKTVLSTKAECLCEAFKTSAQIGIVLNVTKALSLPSVCKIHAPPASNCGLLALSPSGAPATAPGGSAPGPAVNGGGNKQAPSPGYSGSIGFSISVGSLIIGFVVPSFFSF